MKKIKLYTPHSGQKQLHRSKARFRVATCGRRWGKTYACVNEIIKFAWENPKTVNWWIAPVYGQTMIAYRLLTRNFNKAIKEKSKTEKRVQLTNKATIEFKSSDNFDALRGEGVSFMVLDEAAMINREAWEAALRPTLSDTGGNAIFVSTPKGRNWFFELHSRGQDDAYKEYESFKFPTESNPYIEAKEIEEARSTLPLDVFRQEYEAEFLEDSAGVFRGISKCIKGDFEEPKHNRNYVIGWDPAKHQDFSVMFVVDTERRHVVAYDRFNQVDYTIQLSRLENLAKKYNAKVLMDSTGVGDPLLEQVKKKGVKVEGFQFSNTSKQQLVEHLAVLVEREEITFPEIRTLINEMQLFQYEITRAGNVKYNAPEGYHDDCVMALGLAAWGSKARTLKAVKSLY